MTEIGAFEAKTHFSKILERAEHGEEFVVTRRGEPVAKIISYEPVRDIARARKAMDELRARARELNIKATPEEIKEWVNEGRKY